MKRNMIRCLTSALGMALAFVVSSPVAVADYMPPPKSSSLFVDVVEFVEDFGQWNASLNSLPMEFLALAPSSQKDEAAVILFLYWLMEAGPGSNGQPSSSQSDTSGANPVPPSPSSNGSAHPPAGLLVMGQSGNNPSSLHSNGANDTSGRGVKGQGDSGSLSSNSGNGTTSNGGKDTNDPPSLLGQGGNGAGTSLSGGGDDPPGIGGTSGTSSLSSDPRSIGGGGSSGQQLGSIPPSGLAALNAGATPSGSVDPGIDPTPAPASFTLLAVGSAGLLMSMWVRRRRSAGPDWSASLSKPRSEGSPGRDR